MRTITSKGFGFHSKSSSGRGCSGEQSYQFWRCNSGDKILIVRVKQQPSPELDALEYESGLSVNEKAARQNYHHVRFPFQTCSTLLKHRVSLRDPSQTRFPATIDSDQWTGLRLGGWNLLGGGNRSRRSDTLFCGGHAITSVWSLIQTRL
jgi:hypothetical protein